eukprot:SAG22_NODE_226_length_14668_cov_29.647495_8_plen_61_part_00
MHCVLIESDTSLLEYLGVWQARASSPFVGQHASIYTAAANRGYPVLVMTVLVFGLKALYW